MTTGVGVCRRKRGERLWVVGIAAGVGITLAAGALWLTLATAPAAILSAPEAYWLVRDGRAVLIDVRTEAEWLSTGVPAGARTISLWSDGERPNGSFVANVGATVGGELDTPIALVCARGLRSSIAARLLSAYGFTNVHNVPEGMLGDANAPGWIARGLPVKACASCSASEPGEGE